MDIIKRRSIVCYIFGNMKQELKLISIYGSHNIYQQFKCKTFWRLNKKKKSFSSIFSLCFLFLSFIYIYILLFYIKKQLR